MKNLLFVMMTVLLGFAAVASAQVGSQTANSPDTKAVMATLEAMAKATMTGVATSRPA